MSQKCKEQNRKTFPKKFLIHFKLRPKPFLNHKNEFLVRTEAKGLFQFIFLDLALRVFQAERIF